MFVVLFLVCICSFSAAQAQTTPITDTVAYLKSIEARKAEFIGKPFSVLLKELKLPIIGFSPIGGKHSDKSAETGTIFDFYTDDPQESEDETLLDILWQTPLNKEKSSKIAGKTQPRGKWNAEALENYKDAIIRDIYFL